jgi:hypothetical protein
MNKFLSSALLAVLTQAAEEFHMEMENMIIDSLQSQLPATDGKFYSFEAHLGKPALHEELDDCKTPSPAH